MQINPKLKLRTVAGESIVLLQSDDPKRTTKIISLNNTSKFLWESFFGKEFTEEDLIDVIMDNFEGVTREQAAGDVARWVADLKKEDAII